MHLFVYGTLLTTAEHKMGALLRQHGRLIGQGAVQARLYVIDDPDSPGNRYPGALPSANPEDRVYGEVYWLKSPDTVLPAFDAYEACSPDWPEPHEFLRRSIAVRMEDGRMLKAICYLYTWDVSGARPLPSGRFEEAAPQTL